MHLPLLDGAMVQIDKSSPAKRILILGAGFAGLYTALRLANRLRHAHLSAEITLVDRNNYFLFSPLLHEVIPGMLESHHVVHPIRHFFRSLPVHFHETEVQGIDLTNKTVHTAMGDFSYDYLVLAMGSETNFFGNAALARHAFQMKSIEHAVRLRNHVLEMLEAASNTSDRAQRQCMLTFVQVGAGFTGLETITELHDFLIDALRTDYPLLAPEDIKLLLVDALPALPTPADAGLVRYTLRLLAKKHIEVRLNTLVQDATPESVTFANGERLDTRTLIWSAGVTTNSLLSTLPVEKGSGKRLKVLPTLQLPDFPEVFALGDCALFLDNGKPLPTTAQVANQQAPVLAYNLAALLTSKSLHHFKFNRLGELASLGKYHAIAEMGPFHFRGLFAWCLWRMVYLLKLPCWEARVRIAIDWKLGYFFPHDTSRIEAGMIANDTTNNSRNNNE